MAICEGSHSGPRTWPLSPRNVRRPRYCKRRAQPGLVDAPVVMLDPVHQRHRELLPVRGAQLGVIKDRTLRPLDAQLQRDASDHLTCLVAQMATRL